MTVPGLPPGLDPRVTPSNGTAAASELKGVVQATRYVRGTARTVVQPLVNMTDAPRGARVTQLLYGESFRVLDERDGFAFGQAGRDGYCGWILAAALGRVVEPTHRVAAPATHLYPRAEVRAPPEVAVFFGSLLRVAAETDGYARLSSGHFVPAMHLVPVSARFDDPVMVADLMLGTPYLWGGCSRWGVDCSGLVQMALRACGVDCPRDSDQQMALGRDAMGEAPRRGDLVFWDGHVGMVAGPDRLLHANAYHMAVAYEPLSEARARIAAKGGAGTGSGDVRALRRL